jgi:uncharacterized protein YmfQ (DUF2313 family)
MKDSYAPNDLKTNTRVMASYLPIGELFSFSNTSGSNFNKLMIALAKEFGRSQEKLYELYQEYDMNHTSNLLEEWESALGIPDDCFGVEGVSIADRRIHCVAKFAKMNIATEQDWISLADFLGYNITIEHGTKYMTFPLTLPFILGSGKTARFTIIVNFLDLPKPSCVFPLTLPFTFGDAENVLRCVFDHLRPANVQVLYRYLG